MMSAFRHGRGAEKILKALADPYEDTGPSAAPPVHAVKHVPDRIGKYEVKAEIGHGALVRVFRAYDPTMGRSVILKSLTDLSDKPLMARFCREVVAAANVRHAGLVSIYELGEHAGLPFAAAEDLGEMDVRQAVERHASLTLLQKMLLIQQVAEGLQAAHRAGLAYVGPRPSGISLGADGRAAIQDFGIVRLAPEAQDEAAGYASPEELAGSSPDALCDIFALGAIWYELLSGRRARNGDSAEPAPLRAVVPECPEALERVVHRAMEPRRERRYQNLADLQFDAGPIVRELQRARATILAGEARRFLRMQAEGQAQIALSEALQLDPDNRMARRLRKLAGALRDRRILRAHLEALFADADRQAAARCFAGAIEILESALRLQPGNLEAKSRLQEMSWRQQQSQTAAQLLAEATRWFELQDLTTARGKASEALAVDPQNPEASELLRQINDTIEAREREAARKVRLQQQLSAARSLMDQRSFIDAIAAFESLTVEFPDEEAVQRGLAIAQVLAQSDHLGRAGQFEKAVEALDAAVAAYNGEAVLLEQQREVHAQWQAFKVAAMIRQALEEAQWLLDQDRPDLAAQFLRQKSSELPREAALAARLQEIEQILPEWEKTRLVQDCLGRAAALEQVQQGSVALAVIEETLKACPGSEELLAAAERLRARLQQDKLARRLKVIEQKITDQSWSQAHLLVESTQAEFGDTAELQPLREQIQRGQKAAESKRILAEVRQYVSEGDVERAEEIMRGALSSLGDDTAARALWEEVQAEKSYRDQWQAAQLCFGRRQFQEAERILAGLGTQNRPDVPALLEAVRAARAASEERQFYNRGREKALELIGRKQFQQAADVLRNLLSLFPRDPIIERDLQSAQARGGQYTCHDAAIPGEEIGEAEIVPAPLNEPVVGVNEPIVGPNESTATVGPESMFRLPAPRRVPWLVVVPAAFIALICAGAGVFSFPRPWRGAGVAQAPTAISRPLPQTPLAATELGIHGVVDLVATIDRQGAVTNVIGQSGNPLLIAAAKEAILRWRYEPARVNGKPVEIKIPVRVVFDADR